MLYFDSDYMEGCHPAILQRLETINYKKIAGYGTDDICNSAKEKIKKACKCSKAEVFFLEGGTQTNSTVLAGLLQPYQGVIAAKTGHIACHEAGAIEFTGHKVLELESVNNDGKLDAKTVEEYCKTVFGDGAYEHLVSPGAVYISQPTEFGTLYTADEIKALSKVCKKNDLKFYVDGARLGYALASDSTDVTLPLLAKYTDAFYIGGTKVGALFGEAVVLTKPDLIPHFFTIIKQHGALLAKGWVLGVQFDELFKDNRYLEISKNAIAMAKLLVKGLKEKEYQLFVESPTNQQFAVIENSKLDEMLKKVSLTIWQKYDDSHTVVRFVTSWATTTDQINELMSLL